MRIISKTPPPAVETAKRLGVDNFAFKKKRNYSTLLIDLDGHTPIDLLPNREGKTLETWLRNHKDAVEQRLVRSRVVDKRREK